MVMSPPVVDFSILRGPDCFRLSAGNKPVHRGSEQEIVGVALGFLRYMLADQQASVDVAQVHGRAGKSFDQLALDCREPVGAVVFPSHSIDFPIIFFHFPC